MIPTYGYEQGYYNSPTDVSIDPYPGNQSKVGPAASAFLQAYHDGESLPQAECVPQLGGESTRSSTSQLDTMSLYRNSG